LKKRSKTKAKKHEDYYSDENEIEKIKQIAKKALRLKFDKIVRSGSEANMVGIQSENMMFSQRLDSRTYFVQDKRYGVDRELGVFKGSDQMQLKLCHTIIKQLDIPVSEIAEEVILKERMQVAQFNSETKKLLMEDLQERRKLVRLSRQIDGIPIWSSNLTLGLTKDRQIGFMQLHWPEIPAHIITEAHRLAYKVKHGWSPPEKQGTTVEAIDGGIIHSPAIGLIMDIYPVIRVVYAPIDKTFGKKPVLYLDRDGKSVPSPRQSILPVEVKQQRKTPT
jgi:hypothetical protein